MAFLDHKTTGHGCYPPATIITGASTLFVENKAVSMVGSKIKKHCCNATEDDPSTGGDCHDGTITTGVDSIQIE